MSDTVILNASVGSTGLLVASEIIVFLGAATRVVISY